LESFKLQSEFPERSQKQASSGSSNTSPSLKPHQVVGVQWMCRLFACSGGGVLADDMGLGKTVQVIEALRACAAFIGGNSSGCSYIALAVVPLSVIPNWTSEASKWWPGVLITALIGNDDTSINCGRHGRIGDDDDGASTTIRHYDFISLCLFLNYHIKSTQLCSLFSLTYSTCSPEERVAAIARIKVHPAITV
jgi:SNF2 family DNA or RNA helicase